MIVSKCQRRDSAPRDRLSRQIVRVLAIIRYLQASECGATLKEIQQLATEDHRFEGVCGRTVQRDLKACMHAGVVAVQETRPAVYVLETLQPVVRHKRSVRLLDKLRDRAEREEDLFAW